VFFHISPVLYLPLTVKLWDVQTLGVELLKLHQAIKGDTHTMKAIAQLLPLNAFQLVFMKG
jgi:hypothetical protein